MLERNADRCLFVGSFDSKTGFPPKSQIYSCPVCMFIFLFKCLLPLASCFVYVLAKVLHFTKSGLAVPIQVDLLHRCVSACVCSHPSYLPVVNVSCRKQIIPTHKHVTCTLVECMNNCRA